MDIWKCTPREITKRLKREGWSTIERMGSQQSRFWAHPHREDIIQTGPYMKRAERVACFAKAGWGVPRAQSLLELRRDNQRLTQENQDIRRCMLELLDKVDRMVGSAQHPLPTGHAVLPGLCRCGLPVEDNEAQCLDCMAADKAREHHASLFPQLRMCK